jgi:hypothetical protein
MNGMAGERTPIIAFPDPFLSGLTKGWDRSYPRLDPIVLRQEQGRLVQPIVLRTWLAELVQALPVAAGKLPPLTRLPTLLMKSLSLAHAWLSVDRCLFQTRQHSASTVSRSSAARFSEDALTLAISSGLHPEASTRSP